MDSRSATNLQKNKYKQNHVVKLLKTRDKDKISKAAVEKRRYLQKSNSQTDM